ncbi:hypothetical protein TWF481_003051 [Arthrobotrys musiformis]|uniref:Uncharacterized protein n=1 Tax=Arthrobotrys musiformis TaxID=47236 RepID=A0AAV9VPE2_9PEZI
MRLYGPWGCRKRVKTEEWVQIHKELAAREADGKTETQVVLKNGTCISRDALDRGIRRNVTFTDMAFVMAARLSDGDKDGGNKSHGVRDIEVYTPPSFDSAILPFKIWIPRSVFNALPIVRSQASLNAVLQRGRFGAGSLEVSAAKAHPSMALLKVLLFRLSNNLLEKMDLFKLLDSINELGYRGALKELLSLKTISTEAACHNIMPILYIRLDEDLILHTRSIYPDREFEIYRLAWDIISDLLWGGNIYGTFGEDRNWDEQLTAFTQSRRFKFLFNSPAIIAITSKSSSIRLILAHIRRYRIRPNSVGRVRLLLLLCEHYLGDLGLFFELWDPIKIPTVVVESLGRGDHGEMIYTPLATADSPGIELLYNAGFRHGKPFAILRATIAADGKLFQTCLEVLYPDWWLNRNKGFLSFDTDARGQFTDDRTQEILWQATMDLVASDSRLVASSSRRGPFGTYTWPHRCDTFTNRVGTHRDPAGKAREYYLYLLIYIGTIRQDLADRIFDHIWYIFARLLPPVCERSAETYIRRNYDEFLSDVIAGVSIGAKNPSKPYNRHRKMFRFYVQTPFLGQPSFTQSLAMAQKIIGTVSHATREQLWELLASKILYSLDYEIDQSQLLKLIACLQETGFDINSPIISWPSCSDTSKLYSLSPFIDYVPVGQQRPLDISFRRGSPTLFCTLLSSGADPSNLQSSLKVINARRTINIWGLRSEIKWVIGREFSIAVSNRDCGRVLELWDISIFIPNLEVELAEVAARDTLSAIERGETTMAVNNFLQHVLTPRRPAAVYECMSCLGKAISHELWPGPGTRPPSQRYKTRDIARFLMLIVTAPKASLSRDWRSESAGGLSSYSDFWWIDHTDNLLTVFHRECIQTLFQRAIQSDDVELLEEVSKNPTVLTLLLEDSRALFRIYINDAVGCSLGSLKLLIKAGDSVEELYRQGLRPLHRAINRGQFNTIVYLLREGADIFAGGEPPNRPETAIEVAARCGQIDTISLFLEVYPSCANHALNAARKAGQPHIEKYVRNWMAGKETVVNPDPDVESSGLETFSEVEYSNKPFVQVNGS